MFIKCIEDNIHVTPDSGWYFHDEAEQLRGPFKSKEEAKKGSRLYVVSEIDDSIDDVFIYNWWMKNQHKYFSFQEFLIAMSVKTRTNND